MSTARLGTAALVGLLLCAPTRLHAQDGADANLALGQQVAARIDSAFASLVDSARRDTTTFAWFLELARLKSQRVGWAVENHGDLRAVTTVRREAYFVVVPTDDPAYARMGSVMETDRGASIRASRVKADTIAAAWMAVFLAFELSHMRDDLLNLLPQDSKDVQYAKSSRRAYQAEYLAARILGGSALEQYLDSVVSAAAPRSARSFAEGMIPILQQSFARLDAFVSSQKALTEREEQRRVGVFAAALLLRYAERHPVSDLDFATALRCIGGCQ